VCVCEDTEERKMSSTSFNLEKAVAAADAF